MAYYLSSLSSSYSERDKINRKCQYNSLCGIVNVFMASSEYFQYSVTYYCLFKGALKISMNVQ